MLLSAQTGIHWQARVLAEHRFLVLAREGGGHKHFRDKGVAQPEHQHRRERNILPQWTASASAGEVAKHSSGCVHPVRLHRVEGTDLLLEGHRDI